MKIFIDSANIEEIKQTNPVFSHCKDVPPFTDRDRT